MEAGVLVGHGRLSGPVGGVAHVDGSRQGSRLDARSGVDQVTGDHPLSGRSDRHRRLSGEDPCPRSQVRPADLLAESRHRLGEVERGANGAFGVVLLRHRRAPDRHDRVSDELLDGPSVAADQRPAGVEVPAEEVANLVGVT